MMGLLDIAIFMGFSRIVPRRLYPIMRHEGLVTSGPVFSLLLAQLLDCRAQMVSSMLLGDTTDLPEGFLNAFCQSLKGLAETDGGSLHIRVGEHEMIDQMGKGLTCNRDPQIFHMGKIGLAAFAWCMDLFKDDVFFWSVQCSPPGNMSAQRAILRWTIAIRVPFTQQCKERGGLERRIAFELFDHPGPVFLKRI